MYLALSCFQTVSYCTHRCSRLPWHASQVSCGASGLLALLRAARRRGREQRRQEAERTQRRQGADLRQGPRERAEDENLWAEKAEASIRC